MEIVFLDKKLQYEVNSTLGAAFVVERVSGEPFDAFGHKDNEGNLVNGNIHHVYLMLWYFIKESNKAIQDELTFDWFISGLTTPKFNELFTYTIKRWSELEGWTTEKKDKEDNQKKD